MSENEEKVNEKTNIIGGKTRYLTYSTAIENLRLVGSGAAGVAKAINDNKAA